MNVPNAPAPPPAQHNITQIIARVLQEMEKLEGNIRRAEAGRAQAEGELLEVAMYKQASDEALNSLVVDMKAFVPVITDNINLLNPIISSAQGDQKTQLERLKTNLDKLRTEIDVRLTKANQDKSKTATEVNRRASILCEKIDLQAPPPPPLNVPNAPAPPLY